MRSKWCKIESLCTQSAQWDFGSYYSVAIHYPLLAVASYSYLQLVPTCLLYCLLDIQYEHNCQSFRPDIKVYKVEKATGITWHTTRKSLYTELVYLASNNFITMFHKANTKGDKTWLLLSKKPQLYNNLEIHTNLNNLPVLLTDQPSSPPAFVWYDKIHAGTFCNTRLHLGFSDKFRI